VGSVFFFISRQPRNWFGHAGEDRQAHRIAIGIPVKQARTMPLREVKARLSEAIDSSQGAYVLVTRHGRPAAIIVGVEGSDLTDVAALSTMLISRRTTRRT
jgi:prevent-host-death family protein